MLSSPCGRLGRVPSFPALFSLLAMASSGRRRGSKNHSNDRSGVSLPKVLVFDLDGCVWDPEMYELWGRGGSPFKVRSDGDLDTCSGERVYLLGDVRSLMREFTTDKWKDTKVAVASRCDEPSWARECIKKFVIDEGIKLEDAMDGPIEIYKGCKSNHLRAIAKKTGFSLHDMMFFDNEYGNCHTVAKMGVTTLYTPDGVTRQGFEEALEKFPTTDGTILGPKKRPGWW